MQTQEKRLNTEKNTDKQKNTYLNKETNMQHTQDSIQNNRKNRDEGKTESSQVKLFEKACQVEKWFLKSMCGEGNPCVNSKPSQVAIVYECIVTIRAEKYFINSLDCAVTAV